MKQARSDERRVTLKYRFDRVTGKTTLTVDVEVPEDDMPHEHRQDLKEMAEELMGVPLGSLPPEVTVSLKPAGKAKAHDHDHDHDHSHEHEQTSQRTKQGTKS